MSIESIEAFKSDINADLELYSKLEEEREYNAKYNADTHDLLRSLSWYILNSNGSTIPNKLPFKNNGFDNGARWVSYDDMCEEIRDLRVRLLAQQ